MAGILLLAVDGATVSILGKMVFIGIPEYQEHKGREGKESVSPGYYQRSPPPLPP